MKKRDLFINEVNEVIEQVRNLPIVDVLQAWGVHLIKRGQNYFTYSPARPDFRPNSVSVSPRLNIFKDFACEGVGGDAITFIRYYTNCSYVRAAFDIALRFGLITTEEYDTYFANRKIRKDYSEKLEQKYRRMSFAPKQESVIAPPETLHQVYSAFIEECTLSKEHQNYLLKRKLSIEEIKKHGFFTFPTRAIRKRFLDKITKQFGSQDVLQHVPGFYQEEGEDYNFISYRGIGIPIRDAYGRIVGIQIRRDKVDDFDKRYIWFSSSFAIDDPKGKYKNGTSSGSPIGVVYPEEIHYSTVFITEGYFKALQLSKEYKSVAITVQGVSTWRGIPQVLKDIPQSEEVKKRTNKRYHVGSVVICFDADMNYKPQIFKQAKNMGDSIEALDIPVYYMNWHLDYGKGIDDVLLAGHKDKIQKYDKACWDEAYEKVIQKALEGEREESLYKISSEAFKWYFEKYMNVSPLKPNELSKKHLEILQKRKAVFYKKAC